MLGPSLRLGLAIHTLPVRISETVHETVHTMLGLSLRFVLAIHTFTVRNFRNGSYHARPSASLSSH